MKLVDNWKTIAIAAHSMWAAYLGFLQLAIPEVLYLTFGYQIGNPYFTGWAGLALIAYGIFGRLVDQGVSTNSARPASFMARNKTILLVLVLLVAGNAATAMGDDTRPVPGIPVSNEVSEKEFLAVAIPFVGKWEGLRLEAYRDLVGVVTICYGETKGVVMGMKFTKRQCDDMLARELISYRNGWHGYLTETTVMLRLTPKRDAAFVSLAYNVGVAGAGRSTATRRLNAGDIAGSCQALTWWNRAGQKVVRGLVRRRSEEHTYCMAGL